MYFPSRKDLMSGIIYWGLTLLPILIYVFGRETYGWHIITNPSVTGYIGIVFLISWLILIVWMWFRTGYKIENGLIKIKSGPFKKTIKIREVKQLDKTKAPFLAMSPFAAPALSVNRLEVTYGKHYDVMNISPKNKINFIEVLISENRFIEIDKGISVYKQN